MGRQPMTPHDLVLDLKWRYDPRYATASDGQLLDRYFAARDETALCALRRLGDLLQGVEIDIESGAVVPESAARDDLAPLRGETVTRSTGASPAASANGVDADRTGPDAKGCPHTRCRLVFGRNGMSDHHSAREADAPRRRADPLPDRPSLWHPGALFHVATRYPRRPQATKVDRLAGILRHGLIAPADCPDGSVCSDLHLVVTGTAVPYDSLVFLHRYGPRSAIYTLCQPGRFMVFVDPALPVLTPDEMGVEWVMLCQDEVYVRGRVAAADLIGVAVHPADADAVMRDFLAEFRRLGIPLYDTLGNALWPPA